MTFYYKLGAGSYEEHHEATLIHDAEFTKEQFERMVEDAEIAVVKRSHPEWVERDKQYKAYCLKEDPNWTPTEGFDDYEPHDNYGMIFDDIVNELITSNGFSKPVLVTDVWCGAWDTVYDVETCPDCGGERLRGERFDSGRPRAFLPHICRRKEND